MEKAFQSFLYTVYRSMCGVVFVQVLMRLQHDNYNFKTYVSIMRYILVQDEEVDSNDAIKVFNTRCTRRSSSFAIENTV